MAAIVGAEVPTEDDVGQELLIGEQDHRPRRRRHALAAGGMTTLLTLVVAGYLSSTSHRRSSVGAMWQPQVKASVSPSSAEPGPGGGDGNSGDGGGDSNSGDEPQASESPSSDEPGPGSPAVNGSNEGDDNPGDNGGNDNGGDGNSGDNGGDENDGTTTTKKHTEPPSGPCDKKCTFKDKDKERTGTCKEQVKWTLEDKKGSQSMPSAGVHCPGVAVFVHHYCKSECLGCDFQKACEEVAR
jgi:hypothetical protein